MSASDAPTAGHEASADGPPILREPELRLSLPEAGISDSDVLLRMPIANDVDVLISALGDAELREAGNLPD